KNVSSPSFVRMMIVNNIKVICGSNDVICSNSISEDPFNTLVKNVTGKTRINKSNFLSRLTTVGLSDFLTKYKTARPVAIKKKSFCRLSISSSFVEYVIGAANTKPKGQ